LFDVPLTPDKMSEVGNSTSDNLVGDVGQRRPETPDNLGEQSPRRITETSTTVDREHATQTSGEQAFQEKKGKGFYAPCESAQLAAWDCHLQRSKGRTLPRDKHGGWWVETEWPPGHIGEVGAAALEATRDEAPAGRQMLQLQRWGATAAHAKELVHRLIKAAGPHRLAHLQELFDHMEERRRWEKGRKISWIEQQAEQIAAQPLYWPAKRPPRQDSGATAILGALQASGGSATKQQLVAATGKTIHAVSALTRSMVFNGEIRRLTPGVFGLARASKTG
jgi:hypothetical protein